MFKYKIDILKSLSDHGYNTSKLRKDKIMSQATMQTYDRVKVLLQIQSIRSVLF